MKILTFGQNCNFPNGKTEEGDFDEDDLDMEVNVKKKNENKNNRNLLKNIKCENIRNSEIRGKGVLDQKIYKQQIKLNLKSDDVN